MTKNKTMKRRMIENGLLFMGVCLCTFYLIFRSQRMDDLIAVISKVNPADILIGVGCMLVFLSCEAINIGRSLKLFQYPVTFFQCLRYALVGFFFSSVTPSAAGGQPMQLYFMKKDEIQLSHGTLALLIEIASYQVVTVSMALIGFLTQTKHLEQIGAIQYVLLAGVLINCLVLTVLLVAIFSKQMIRKLIRIVIFLLRPFCKEKTIGIEEKLQGQVLQYQESAVYLKKNKKLMVKILLTTIVQIGAIHSVPFWIYRSFGLSGYSFWTVVAMQAMLYIAVSALPLPGAMGVSEGGFLLLFHTLFPASILNSAMLLNRGVSFYLFVAVSGICVLMFVLTQGKNRYKHI